MPIKASFTWTEKKDTVKVIVPLKGVSPSKADVLVSVSTLKVNFSPYILDIVLYKEVDCVKHKASCKDGVLTITLCKKESGIWGCLEKDGNKEELKAAKAEASVLQAAVNESLSQQRHDRKLEEEKHSLRKQMKLEEMERTRVENLKQEEKESAEKEVYEALSQLHMKPQNSSKSTVKKATDHKKSLAFSERDVSSTTPRDMDDFLAGDDIEDDKIYDKKPIYSMEDIDEEYTDEENDTSITGTQSQQPRTAGKEDVEDDEEVRYVPPPRSSGLSANADQKIGISFTPRVFPTPMRESKAAEEEDWVAKNRRHIKNHGVLGKNQVGDVSEEDPVWLKAKGDDFFRSGDMRSALNAYSAALEADPQMLSCLANRSVCFLRLNQPTESRADCTTAMAMITAESADSAQKNAPLYVKMLLRRGAASCQLGMFTEALMDYHQASTRYEQLSGSQIGSLAGVSVESIRIDIARLKLLSDTESLKKEGDAQMAEQQPSRALEKYTAALEMIPVHVSCLSNRSACRLALKDFQGCISDCSTAIALLTYGDAAMTTPTVATSAASSAAEGAIQPEQMKTMLANILPAVGSVKRTTWLLKTLLRRGVAYTQCGDLVRAVEDYRSANALDVTNLAVKDDLERLIVARDAAASAANQTCAEVESENGPDTSAQEVQ